MVEFVDGEVFVGNGRRREVVGCYYALALAGSHRVKQGQGQTPLNDLQEFFFMLGIML